MSRPTLALVHHDAAELRAWYGGAVALAAGHGLDVVLVAPASDDVSAMLGPGVAHVAAPLDRTSAARVALSVPVVAGALVDRGVALVHALSTRAATATAAAQRVARVPHVVVTLDAPLPAPRAGRLRGALSRALSAEVDTLVRRSDRVVVFDGADADAVRTSGVPVSRIARFDAAMGIDVDAIADPTVPDDAARARAAARLGLAPDAGLVVIWGDASVAPTLARALSEVVVERVDATTPRGRAIDLVRMAAVVVLADGDVRVAEGALVAGCLGRPVVAVDGPRTRAVVRHEETGLLTGARPDAVASSVRRVLADGASAERWGRAASRLARRAWDRDLAQRRLLGIYESVLRGGAPVHVATDGRLVPGGRRELT